MRMYWLARDKTIDIHPQVKSKDTRNLKLGYIYE